MDRLNNAICSPIEEILGLVLSETGYQKQLQGSEDEDDQERLANIEELLTVARDFDERHGEGSQLEAFLEETCLVNDTDAWETDADRVTLMTLHASKGLEFPVVYLTAVEEGLLPHERSREHPEQLEEERRLMFVGITRAQQELQISMARYRDFRGQRKLTIPSSFLMELPRAEMNLESCGGGSVSSPSAPLEDAYSQLAAHDEDDCHEPRQETEDCDCSDAEDAAPFGESDATFFEEEECVDAAPKRPPLPALRLTTAAALAGESCSPTFDPDVFCHGAWVLHASFGLGQIVALSGNDENRKATIDFAPPVGRKMLLVAESSLCPVGKNANRSS
jgi:DNA helicase-2/ATP-dependent DNA helicase PcrA